MNNTSAFIPKVYEDSILNEFGQDIKLLQFNNITVEFVDQNSDKGCLIL